MITINLMKEERGLTILLNRVEFFLKVVLSISIFLQFYGIVLTAFGKLHPLQYVSSHVMCAFMVLAVLTITNVGKAAVSEPKKLIVIIAFAPPLLICMAFYAVVSLFMPNLFKRITNAYRYRDGKSYSV
jgi:hypothetical protein